MIVLIVIVALVVIWCVAFAAGMASAAWQRRRELRARFRYFDVQGYKRFTDPE